MDNSGLIADALYKTDPTLYAMVDGNNSWKNGLKRRGDRVAKYRRYERGEHDSSLTDQMRKMLRLSANRELNDFNINYCRIVIDKMVSRLRVSEITSNDEAQDDYITEVVQRNDWLTKQGEYFRAAIRDGDSYIMIDPDTLKWVSEPAYDGYSGVVAIYSPMEEQPLWACKLWSQNDANDLAGDAPVSNSLMRVMVYQPERITEWSGTANTTELVRESEIDWFAVNEIPIVHFVNLADNYNRYGESEIRAALPLQDVLNRTLHSMVMASEFSAFKIAWSIGMEIDKSGITPGAVLNLVLQDADGNVISDMTQEQVEFLRAVRVGEFSESDISQYTNQLSEITKHISQVTQTPIYGVTNIAANISGEALKQLEIGLIGKIQRFQNENIGAVQRLLQLTSQIQNVFDNSYGQAPDLPDLDINWKPAEIVNLEVAVTTLLDIRERAPGLFDDDFIRQRIGSLMGLSQAQIQDEGDKAQASSMQMLDLVTGAAGGIPAVV